MSDQAQQIETRISREKTAEIATLGGSITFANVDQVMEFAKVMALGGVAIPKHLRGSAGTCLAVCMQALEWRMSPFSVANKSYSVNDRLAYEAQLVAAVVLQRAPIIGRIKYEYLGEGATRQCKASAKLRDSDGGETVEYTTPMVKDIKVKNSPLWQSDPDQQLSYFAARSMCRRHFPDVLLGVYADDEIPQSDEPKVRETTIVEDKEQVLPSGMVIGATTPAPVKEPVGEPVVETTPPEKPVKATTRAPKEKPPVVDAQVVEKPVAATVPSPTAETVPVAKTEAARSEPVKMTTSPVVKFGPHAWVDYIETWRDQIVPDDVPEYKGMTVGGPSGMKNSVRIAMRQQRNVLQAQTPGLAKFKAVMAAASLGEVEHRIKQLQPSGPAFSDFFGWAINAEHLPAVADVRELTTDEMLRLPVVFETFLAEEGQQ